jgi:hypothetical protein
VRTLAFCDPGLDRVSIAIFRFTTGPRQLWDLAGQQDRLKTLVRVRAVKTSPKEALAERLLAIGRGVHEILTQEKADRLYVEIPRTSGTYARHAAGGYGDNTHGHFADSMQFTHYATGAIICAAGTVLPGRVIPVKAQGGAKDKRLERVRMLLQSIGRRAEVRNADDLDAIAIGLGETWPR